MKAKQDKKLDTSLEKERTKVLKQFFSLDTKAMQHLQDSVIAQSICSYCTAEGKASKKDAQKKCLQCHGTNLVPNVSRRDWATEEIFSRISPKPKSIEMALDDKRDYEEFKKGLEGKSDKVINDLAKDLGVNFEEDR